MTREKEFADLKRQIKIQKVDRKLKREKHSRLLSIK